MKNKASRKIRSARTPDDIRAALYIRVSTEAQAEEGYSIDAQKERLQAYCVSKGIKHYEFYIDGAYSGSNIQRPALERMIDDVRMGRLTHIIVYKLDRLSRSQKDTLYLIEDIFNPNGVDFVSMEENFDTSSPIGRAMLGILSAFAQLERETIYERTRMGMRERVKKGMWPGGGKVPFGYDYDQATGTLIPNADAEKVRQMYEMYLDGYSPQKIADILGLKYEQWVTDILSRRLNAGYITFSGNEYKGLHRPIVSEETFNRTKDLMRLRSKNRRYTANHLLTGMVYCGVCGAKMRYQKWGNAGFKLVCYSQQTSKKYLVKDAMCDNSRPWANEVEKRLLESIFSMQYAASDNATHANKPDITEILTLRRDELRTKLKRLYELYAAAQDDLLLETIKTTKQSLDEAESRLIDEQNKADLDEQNKQAAKKYEGLRSAWKDMTFSEQRSAVEELVDRIVVNGDTVDIYYRFEM